MDQDGNTRDEKMSWWRSARFGMFVHWGPYAQWAGQYRGHQQARGGAEWIMNRCKIPMAEYQERARSFDPTAWDPDAVAKLAESAGMRYLIFTAKHHDGFAMFPTQASTFNIVDHAGQGDIVGPLVEACRRHGLKAGLYYSQSQDWNNPGGATARKEMAEGWPNPDAEEVDAFSAAHGGAWDPGQLTRSFADYVDQVGLPQVRELLTRYEDTAILWWDTPMGITTDQARRYTELLALKPGIITNDRLKRPDFPGDTSTPEGHVPGDSEVDERDWEACMTMGTSWGYKSWEEDWKSAQTLIRTLVDAASKGGNFLLNIGPRADGSIPQESIERLLHVGEWMDLNGRAIHGTEASPLPPLGWGRCTATVRGEQTSLFLHVFDWPEDGAVLVPGLTGVEVRDASLLADGAPVPWEPSADGLRISLPGQAPTADVSVVEVVVEAALRRRVSRASEAMTTGALDA